ncbi:MAG: TIGR02302 family protein [Alphaproteobacteria bacterium]|nr:TIGR02302 family protein [Alphaproteobacteria bacterium]
MSGTGRARDRGADRTDLRRTVLRALARRQGLARAAIFWERLWPALWPALAVVLLFLLLALVELWRWLPGWPHVLALVLFSLALVLALVLGLKHLRLPDRAAAERRLERASGFDHRPLATLRDEVVGGAGDAGARSLWRLHQQRTIAAIRGLKVGWPRAGLARRDPWGLRAVLGLGLFIGLAAAGGDWGGRVARALSPEFRLPSASPSLLEAWITPPAYTGVAPLVLTDADPAAAQDNLAILAIPRGSVLLARVSGKGLPELRIDAATMPFESIDADNHQIEMNIESGSEIAVLQEQQELGRWRIEVTPDRPPSVDFGGQVAATPRAALKLPFDAADDYGIESLSLQMWRQGNDADTAEEFALPLPSLRPRRTQGSGTKDLTPHPWAGLEVMLRLAVRDSLDQTGLSKEIQMMLPERQFNHPVARALIEQRKRLTREPEARQSIARALVAIASFPDKYFDDAVAFLGMRSAASRLLHDRTEEAIGETQEILWDTALRIEDGEFSLAERELRKAEEALLEALAREADDAELERLMNELEAALDKYLQALTEMARRQAEEGVEPQPFDPDMMMIDRQDLARIMDRIRELNRMGARQAARELLSQLRNLMENLRSSVMTGQPQQNGPGQRLLRDLGELMRRQQELLDQTFRAHQLGRRGELRMPDGRQGSAAQEALRRALGDIMRRLGEGRGNIPEALGRAERSMKGARQALEGGNPGAAVGPQGEALDQLRQGAGSLMRQMMGQLGRTPGRAGQPRRLLGRGNVDPLGRPLPGDGTDIGNHVKIPNKAAMQRAREILDELHRRAGQRQRPELERDYIDRLLRRF